MTVYPLKSLCGGSSDHFNDTHRVYRIKSTKYRANGHTPQVHTAITVLMS